MSGAMLVEEEARATAVPSRPPPTAAPTAKRAKHSSHDLPANDYYKALAASPQNIFTAELIRMLDLAFDRGALALIEKWIAEKKPKPTRRHHTNVLNTVSNATAAAATTTSVPNSATTLTEETQSHNDPTVAAPVGTTKVASPSAAENTPSLTELAVAATVPKNSDGTITGVVQSMQFTLDLSCGILPNLKTLEHVLRKCSIEELHSIRDLINRIEDEKQQDVMNLMGPL